ncbi:hypothetical protein PF003_g28085 [Phytophthora fragariae]|nr:hypothetical protein PF003_g28085 [Phytophthora fragariae]
MAQKSGLHQFPLLQQAVLQIFRCASSSAAPEQNISTHGYIHSKLRNRLAPEKVEKLVSIFLDAKNIDSGDLDHYNDIEDLIREAQATLDENGTPSSRDADFVYY